MLILSSPTQSKKIKKHQSRTKLAPVHHKRFRITQLQGQNEESKFEGLIAVCPGLFINFPFTLILSNPHNLPSITPPACAQRYVAFKISSRAAKSMRAALGLSTLCYTAATRVNLISRACPWCESKQKLESKWTRAWIHNRTRTRDDWEKESECDVCPWVFLSGKRARFVEER